MSDASHLNTDFDEAPELLARYARAVGLHMVVSLLLVTAGFALDSVWPQGTLTWEDLADTSARWADTASRLALPTLGIIVGLLLPLYLAPLGSKDLERKAATDEDSLTHADHEVLAIQDVRENLILLLATTGAVVVWWMLPAALTDPMFVVIIFVLAAVFGALATIREATFGRAAMHILRSHRAHRGLTRLLERLGVEGPEEADALSADLSRARRIEAVLILALLLAVPLELWMLARGLGFRTPALDAGIISVVVVPYLIWRWTGTRRSRIRRAKLSGSGSGEKPTAVGAALAVAVDASALVFIYALGHAASGSHWVAVAVVAVVGVALWLLVGVLPRWGRFHKLLLIDAALRARRRTDAGQHSVDQRPSSGQA